MYETCSYPYFKQKPSNINLNLGFFKDNLTIILPQASFDTKIMDLISDQNISFVEILYDQKKFSSKLFFDFNEIEKADFYIINITLTNFKSCK